MSPTQKPAAFDTLGLSDALVALVAGLGYEEATPVQRQAIPLMLEGQDLLAQAGTGTGKTAAFALPIIQILQGEDDKGEGGKGEGGKGEGGKGEGGRGKGEGAKTAKTRAMVLVPTRELAMQVAEAVHRYSRGSNLHVVPLYGGASMQQQIRALQRGADIVVATPGRALDHIRRTTLLLDAIRVVILDEADEMLDMGFADDIDAILQSTPTTRHTALFSATMPARILAIAKRHLHNPARVTIAQEKTATGKLPRVRQVAYVVRRDQKPSALDRILDIEDPTSAIVFCRTRLEVDTLVETLNAHGYRAEALHGGMQQRQRDAVMNRVRSQKTDLLIATDVAARGLDIEHLSHVINYDLPAEPESYLHRIGRTGRAGREGTAISLVEPREHRMLRMIEQLTKQKIDVATVPTVADLRARRMEVTRASIHEQLVAGGFDDVRVIVESLAGEFDLVDVAAAAVKVAHLASSGDGDETEFAIPQVQEPRAARGRSSGGRGDLVRLWVGAGRQAGIRPGDLVGAISGEAGIPSQDLGAIQITDRFSLIEVPAGAADEIVAVMKKATLRGQKVTIRRDREAS